MGTRDVTSQARPLDGLPDAVTMLHEDFVNGDHGHD